ncbi:MAG: hypothetical protein L3J31_07830 [Bacteroidales bacterium]|nr:hypothetical protein [Bacteroidales bacterium]MCF6342695.1 hypothetical protein [Bacteroidales bacterium]
MKKIIFYISIFLFVVTYISSCCKEDFDIPGTTQTARYVFVSCNNADSVSVIDATTFQKVADLSGADIGLTTYEPRNLDVSSDGRLVFVPFRHSDNVLVIDAATLSVTTGIEDDSFDEPYALSFTPDDQEVWVVNKQGGGSTTGSVTVISTSTNKVVSTIDDDNLSSPEGICIANGKAYVANRGNGTVTVFSVAGRTFVANIDVGGEPRFAIPSKNGDFVYVTSVSGGLAKINTTVDTVAGLIDAYGRNAAMSPDGSKLFVASGNEIFVVTTADGQVANITVPDVYGFYAVALLSDGSMGFATDENQNLVYAFDPTTGTVLNNGEGIPVGSRPRAIAAQ